MDEPTLDFIRTSSGPRAINMASRGTTADNDPERNDDIGREDGHPDPGLQDGCPTPKS